MRIPGEKWDKQTIWLWDVTTGKVRRQFGPEYRVRSGLMALSCRMARTLMPATPGCCWTRSSISGSLPAVRNVPVMRGHGDVSIFASAFTPDGKFLAPREVWTKRDSPVADARRQAAENPHVRGTRRGWVLNLAFASNGEKLVSTSLDTTGVVWKLPPLAQPQQAKLTPADQCGEAMGRSWPLSMQKAAYQAIGVRWQPRLKTISPVSG